MKGLPPDHARRLLVDLVANLPTAVAAFDRDMRCIVHSRTWLAVHGSTREGDVVGLLHYEVFPHLRDEWRRIHERCLLGATERSELDYFEREDGQRLYLRWLVTPWRLDDGSVGGLLIHVENLTSEVETRRRLEEQESTIRAFFSRSPVGLNLCRMDGRWLESNDAFLEIIGYPRSEADALTYWQLTPRKYDADEARQLEHLRTTRRYGPYEKEFIRKDGTLVPVRLTGFLIERDGETLIWSLIEDMTEQRALERKLDEERLKAIHASKLAVMGEMAASFAHEINNPLGIIELYAYTLRDAIGQRDEVHIEEALSAIRSAASRAGKIVHGLGKFSREAAHEPHETLAVSDVVEDALTLCRPRFARGGIALRVEVATSSFVRGHAIELSQVLVNLLNNAHDAARPTVARWVRLEVRDADDAFVELAVEDSGVPLPEDAASRIFRAFFTTKKIGEGTGLGLSISRAIVERHGGTLTLEPAGCTRFVVRLPRVDPLTRARS